MIQGIRKVPGEAGLKKNWIAGVMLPGLILGSSTLQAMTSCELHYNLRGWSFIYKKYTGTGSIHCQNGQSAAVNIESHSGGATIGKSEINDGHGVFSEVRNIRETFGTYVAAGGHAGATRSVEGQAMTKGEVSLALSGKGRGFDLGIAIGAFTITPR